MIKLTCNFGKEYNCKFYSILLLPKGILYELLKSCNERI